MAEPLTNEDLTIEHIVRPLSLEALQYFAADNLPKAEGSFGNTRLGKFVRIGEVMLIGTTIDFGKPNWQGIREGLVHWQMREYLERFQPELLEIAKAQYEAEKSTAGGGLHDAGRTAIRVNEVGEPIRLEIGGSSYDFGRADEAGRQRSIEIAQTLVGDTITIVQDER